ncbi:hypothetical protein INT45_010220 [Circinella minor]|uniref:Uncharacterized protein n=1 Tax=Circinella minor TaxID=1195481 RepID=A0A8H7VLC2_9FUNG|nr:hypothetical protein INT45_010220 [Circinella minor]
MPPIINNSQGGHIIINQSGTVNIHQSGGGSSSSALHQSTSLGTKRSHNQMEKGDGKGEEGEGEEGELGEENSVDSSWKSKEEGRERKALRVYLKKSYRLEKKMLDKWEVGSLNVTNIFYKYRKDSIKGAKERKRLSDGRVLCPISSLSAYQQHLIFDDLNTEHHYEHLDDLTLLAFRKIQCAVPSGKVATANVIDTSSTEGEAKFIIETITPFLKHAIIKNMDILTNWMTYHLKPSEIDQRTLIPDFGMYTEPYSSKNVEFMFLEGKKQGKQANIYESDLVKLKWIGSNPSPLTSWISESLHILARFRVYIERNIVKLGKEINITVVKLVNERANDPEVVDVIVKDMEMTTYHLDLKYTLSRKRFYHEGRTYRAHQNAAIMNEAISGDPFVEYNDNNYYDAVNDNNVADYDYGYDEDYSGEGEYADVDSLLPEQFDPREDEEYNVDSDEEIRPAIDIEFDDTIVDNNEAHEINIFTSSPLDHLQHSLIYIFVFLFLFQINHISERIANTHISFISVLIGSFAGEEIR